MDVIGDDDDLELKRLTVLEKLAVLNTLPGRGTLLSAREYTLSQLEKVVRTCLRGESFENVPRS
jgi:hypothetical protein